MGKRRALLILARHFSIVLFVLVWVFSIFLCLGIWEVLRDFVSLEWLFVKKGKKINKKCWCLIWMKQPNLSEIRTQIIE